MMPSISCFVWKHARIHVFGMVPPCYAVRCSHSLTVIPPPFILPSLFNPPLLTPLLLVLVPYSPVPILSSLLSFPRPVVFTRPHTSLVCLAYRRTQTYAKPWRWMTLTRMT